MVEVVRGQPLVDQLDVEVWAAPTKDVAQDLRPRLEVVGDAVPDGEHGLSGLEGQGVDVRGERGIGEQIARRGVGPASETVENRLVLGRVRPNTAGSASGMPGR
jgi:hypothetical protein